MLLTQQYLYAADTTKRASVPLVWNAAEISSQYFSQAPERSQIWWLCPAMLLDDSGDQGGVLRAFLAVSTKPFQSSYARCYKILYYPWSRIDMLHISESLEDYGVKARLTHLES